MINHTTRISNVLRDAGGPPRPRLRNATQTQQNEIRLLESVLVARHSLLARMGKTFKGERDMYDALGYKEVLDIEDFRTRYFRNGLAARVVESMPKATWRTGGEVIEDQNPDVITPFEKAWDLLNKQHRLWSIFKQVDIVAGIGQYAILMLGLPGTTDTEATPVLNSKKLAYLTVYGQRWCSITEYDQREQSARFGLPTMYTVTRYAPIASNAMGGNNATAGLSKRVHYSRCIHVAEGLLDDRVFGQPRLERVWNNFDDLDKVVGGGAEAYWRRGNAGMQVDLDPSIRDMKDAAKTEMKNQIDEYIHNLRRVLTTRGVDINMLSASASDFKGSTDAIISLIAAGSEIPQRILMGSERGELASSMDRDEFSQRISDRRSDFAGPTIVRPFTDRCIALNILPKPKDYEVRFPELKNLDETQLVEIAQKYATINATFGETVFTNAEIRELVGKLPLDPSQIKPTGALTPAQKSNDPADVVAPKKDDAARAALRAAISVAVTNRLNNLSAQQWYALPHTMRKLILSKAVVA